LHSSFFCLSLSAPAFEPGRSFPNKKPAIDWQSRVVLEILCFRLELSVRVAKRRVAAMPNPDQSGLTLLPTLLHCKRGVHVQPGLKNTTWGSLSKKFLALSA
jgi:hypothetical protein